VEHKHVTESLMVIVSPTISYTLLSFKSQFSVRKYLLVLHSTSILKCMTLKMWNLYFVLLILLFYLLVIFCRVQGVINITSTYDSRTQEVEGSIAARGGSWRVEATRGGSTSGNENSSMTVVQLGSIHYIRDSALLLPVHISNQCLLLYGYDIKVNTRFSW
jgi:hypothetical protein